ncbi:MAG: putative phage tail assembly chaperone [Parashewanella sp.]
MKQAITLTIGKIDFTFNHSTADHNSYLNGLMPDDKVAPARQLLTRTIKKEQHDQLVELLDSNPGSEMQIAASLNQEFAPKLEIAVKKS